MSPTKVSIFWFWSTTFTSLCPSVATAVIPLLLKLNNTPVSDGFRSSLLTANSVESIMFLSIFPGILIFFVSSIFGVAGNSSFCFPIKSYDPEFVFISVLFLLSTIIVILVSGSSFVISYNCFNGTAADPSSSILTEISKSIAVSYTHLTLPTNREV